MDYGRIYRDFIEDRKAREAQLVGYSEKHHIIPRSLGGGNEAENLIRLTPEDHYFAHLLLAKSHGGKMWAALYAMAHLTNVATKEPRTKLQCRIRFGHVRRSLASYYRDLLSGPEGPVADSRKHTLHHMDGRSFTGNRFELEAATGIDRQRISAVLLGAKKSAHGWYCMEHNPRGLSRSEQLSEALRDKTRHHLFHFDGREWSGTLGEFQDFTCARLDWQGPHHRSIQGWYRVEADARQHFELKSERAARSARARGSISGTANPMAGSDRRKDMAVSLTHSDGRSFHGSLKALADDLGLKASQYGQFRKVLLGTRVVGGFKVLSFHGWKSAAG